MTDTTAGAPTPVARAVLTVFLPFSGGYFLSYLYRSVNAIIAPQLVDEVGLSAADLGLLTSAFFLTFAAFQLPLGILLDRYGPRRVQAVLLVIAAAGALLFAVGETLETLVLARALLGLGMAGGLMASFKAITQWFDKDRWALVNGCFLGMGGLGAVASTAPVELLLGLTDWRGIFIGLSAVTVAVAMAIFTVAPDRREEGAGEGLVAQLAVLGRIYRDRLFWRIAPIAVMGVATGLAIQTLWAGPWLRDVAGFDRAGVADTLFVTTLALTAGFVLNGVVADWLGRRGVSIMTVIGGGSALFVVSIAAITFELAPTALWPWILFGLVSNITLLGYPVLSRHFPPRHAGRANTALNVLVFWGLFAVQWAMGAIIDLWPETADGGYASEAYQVAFGVFLVLQVLALVWFFVPHRRGD